jgi:putative transposase
VVKKPLRLRWHVCACGVSAQRDLYSAYLARFVNPATSVLRARQAEESWRRGEPLVQAAYQHAITNQRASGRQLLSSFGQPPVDPSETRIACDRSASRS